ncbi:hypothetical protein Csa_023276 [Cucumis sativus]|uniref:Secreted protein n=1 Tax=Cucumis sativus TaxID=3659 RepID=A0A0A0LVG5_CUCSA|nr:hypothetical protein Csa_023276 [Cucumis sativus]
MVHGPHLIWAFLSLIEVTLEIHNTIPSMAMTMTHTLCQVDQCHMHTAQLLTAQQRAAQPNDSALTSTNQTTAQHVNLLFHTRPTFIATPSSSALIQQVVNH